MQTWHYVIIIGALVWVIFRSKKLFGQRKAMNGRVVVKYADHNPEIESLFPLEGTVTRPLLIKSTSFYVITLDKPFEYEQISYDEIIVRERGAGQSLGYGGKTDVHILLPLVKLDKVRYAMEDFDQVAWGTVEPLAEVVK